MASKNAAKHPIKTGILGLGRAGWDIHVKRMRADRRFQIIAVTDGLADRRKQAEEELKCAAFKTFKEVIYQADVELIVNAAPSHLHGPLTIEAFRAGKHVLVEKPCAVDASELKRMIAASKRYDKKLICHHNYRFNNLVKHFLDIRESGWLGEIFEFRMQLNGFNRRNDWQTLKKNNGGLLNNHGTHHFDYALYLMGSPVKDYFCDLKLVSDSGNCEDHVKLVVRLKNGTLIDMEVSTSANVPTQYWQILGNCGSAHSDGKETVIRYFDPKKVKELPVDLRPPLDRRYGNTDTLPWKTKTLPVKSNCRGDFYDNVYEVLREDCKPVVSPDSVLDLIKLFDACKKQKIHVVRPTFKPAGKG